MEMIHRNIGAHAGAVTGVNMQKQWDIGRLLPKQLRSLSDQGQALRARIFAVLLLVCIAGLAPVAITLLALALLGFQGLYAPLLALVSVLCGQVACWLYFHKTGRLNQSIAIYATLIVCLLTLASWFTGGWNSPVNTFLLVVPVILGLVVGKLMCVVYGLVVIGLYSVLFFLSEVGFTFVQLLPEQHLVYINAGLWALTLLAILGSLLLYEFSMNQLSGAVVADRRKLEWQANYDALTGLLNEQRFFEKLHQLCGEEREKSASFSLICLKVDNLNEVINGFGFEFAEKFLSGAAAMLGDVIEQDHDLARYGNDTFLLLMPDVNTGDALITQRAKLNNLHRKRVNVEDDIAVGLCLKSSALLVENLDMDAEYLIDQLLAQSADSKTLYWRI